MRNVQHPIPAIAYLWAVLGTALGSLLLSPLRNLVDLSNVALLYVLAVVMVAVTYGRGPAVVRPSYTSCMRSRNASSSSITCGTGGTLCRSAS